MGTPTSGLVNARWTAGYSVILPDNTVIEPGGTHEIPRGEAETSDNWQLVGGRPAKDETVTDVS